MNETNLPDEFMWAVGLFEGEGSVTIADRNRPRHSPRIRLSLQTTDLDVLERFARVVNAGSINGPYAQGVNKPTWQWRVSGRKAETLIRRFLPELSARRRERALEVLRICVPGENVDQLAVGS